MRNLVDSMVLVAGAGKYVYVIGTKIARSTMAALLYYAIHYLQQTYQRVAKSSYAR
jgi:hypothetical protein